MIRLLLPLRVVRRRVRDRPGKWHLVAQTGESETHPTDPEKYPPQTYRWWSCGCGESFSELENTGPTERYPTGLVQVQSANWDSLGMSPRDLCLRCWPYEVVEEQT